jgi:hypothetical protein
MQTLSKHDARLLLAASMFTNGIIGAGAAGAAAISAVKQAAKDDVISSYLDTAIAVLSQSVEESDVPSAPNPGVFATNMNRLTDLNRIIAGEGAGVTLTLESNNEQA